MIRARKALNGTGYWLGWLSPLYPVWLWHALFDGTRVCCCMRSAQWQDALRQAGPP